MRREIICWFQRMSHLQTHWAWVVWPRLGGFFGFHHQKWWYRSIEQINPPVSSNVLEDPWFIDNCPIQSHSHRPFFSGISMGFSIATVFDDTTGDRFGENDQDVKIAIQICAGKHVFRPEIQRRLVAPLVARSCGDWGREDSGDSLSV